VPPVLRIPSPIKRNVKSLLPGAFINTLLVVSVIDVDTIKDELLEEATGRAEELEEAIRGAMEELEEATGRAEELEEAIRRGAEELEDPTDIGVKSIINCVGITPDDVRNPVAPLTLIDDVSATLFRTIVRDFVVPDVTIIEYV
jgi:hypothetical protein